MVKRSLNKREGVAHFHSKSHSQSCNKSLQKIMANSVFVAENRGDFTPKSPLLGVSILISCVRGDGENFPIQVIFFFWMASYQYYWFYKLWLTVDDYISGHSAVTTALRSFAKILKIWMLPVPVIIDILNPTQTSIRQYYIRPKLTKSVRIVKTVIFVQR